MRPESHSCRLRARCVVAAALIGLAASASAQKIYKWRLPDGSVQYSDRSPAQGAERVTLPTISTYTPQPVRPAAAPGGDLPTAPGLGLGGQFAGYAEFELINPSNELPIRDNAGNVPVQVSASPPLQPGHSVHVLLDGTEAAAAESTSLTLNNVSRGEHSLVATISDEQGRELSRSSSITFYMLRATIQDIAPQNRAPAAPSAPRAPRAPTL